MIASRLRWLAVTFPLPGPPGRPARAPIAGPAVIAGHGQGGLRVTGTRVLLERIVHAFEDGATPEGIVQSYDTLPLADVYAVLAWYLRHKAEVQDYLRKRAEEALRLSEERFRLSVEGVQDYAIFMLSPEGHVASWNAGAERIKGYRADEIIGKHFSCFYPVQDIERGMPPEEARYAALRKIGNVARVKEETREVWSRVWLEQLLQDIRYALRIRRRNTAFTLDVILTLALGIGTATAVFSVVNSVLVKPLA